MVDLDARTDWFKSQILPHEPALRAQLRKRSPANADVDDLVSESLIRAYAAEDWVSVRQGRSYLFRIARNIMVDTARRDAIAGFETMQDLDGMQEDRTTEMTILARDELRQVQRAIETLPPQCRRVFVLRRVHECSIGEIAEEMGLSVSTVEKHLAKALLLVTRAIAQIEESGPDHGRIRSGPDVARGDGGAILCAVAR